MIGYCYKIQMRAFWKIAGQSVGTTTLSDNYLVSFAHDELTWQEQLKLSIRRDESISVRLATGWESFDEYTKNLTVKRNIFHKQRIDMGSELEEFIILGNRAVILPEAHPKDRYIEFAKYNRRGILIVSSVSSDN